MRSSLPLNSPSYSAGNTKTNRNTLGAGEPGRSRKDRRGGLLRQSGLQAEIVLRPHVEHQQLLLVLAVEKMHSKVLTTTGPKGT